MEATIQIQADCHRNSLLECTVFQIEYETILNEVCMLCLYRRFGAKTDRSCALTLFHSARITWYELKPRE